MGTGVVVVVIGGTGHFGTRICRRLLDEAGVDLVVTSRSLPAAQLLARKLQSHNPAATVRGAQLDQSAADFARDLQALAPHIVVHTAGPYQGQDYRAARAAIACGSHYIDLADGRDFVAGFSALHSAALEKDVLAVSGASTLPGLSSAVIKSLADQFGQIDAVEISIAPAHQTPRGRSTIAAVLSYCGKPFDVLDDGQWIKRFGWQHLRLQRYPHLGRRLSALCDVPDLAIWPERLAGVRTVTFHAALEAPWEQLALWMMAGLTRLRLVRNWSRLTPLFHRISERLLWMGSTRGGMHVALRGTDKDGQPLTRQWHLLAQRNHGPEIPCTPALILVRKLVRRQLDLRGAFACVDLISLDDFANEVRDLDIHFSADSGRTYS